MRWGRDDFFRRVRFFMGAGAPNASSLAKHSFKTRGFERHRAFLKTFLSRRSRSKKFWRKYSVKDKRFMDESKAQSDLQAF